MDRPQDAVPDLPVRLYGRASAAAPIVLHCHGGAFAGTLDCGRPVATLIAATGAQVLSADYPCGKGHTFPEALEGVFGLLCRLQVKHGRNRLYVAGEEAGGNLAAALALVARDRRAPRLAGQILLSPMLDPRLATCSIRTAEAGAVDCPWARGWHDYLGRPEAASHPYAAPGSASRLAGVAPALVLIGPDDPMRDEAEAYVARLCEQAVSAECRIIRAGPPWPSALIGGAGLPAAEPPWAAEVRAAITAFITP